MSSGDGVLPTRARASTLEKTEQQKARAAASANAPSGFHPSAHSRAAEPVAGASTAAATQQQVAALRHGAPNKDAIVLYAGPVSASGEFEGMSVQGPRIDRSSWKKAQKNVAKRHDERLKAEGGHSSAPHNKGRHTIEIAHWKRQSAGGFTDSAGAVPAPVGVNVYDQRVEESHDKLSETYGPAQLREVQIGRVHTTGPHAGLLASKVRDLHMRSSTSQPYTHVERRIQSGHREMPDKDEIRLVQAEMKSLNPATSAATVTRPYSLSSTATPVKRVFNSSTRNDSASSTDLSGTRSPGGRWRIGSDATQWWDELNTGIDKGLADPAAAASKKVPPRVSVSINLPFSPPRPESPQTPPPLDLGSSAAASFSGRRRASSPARAASTSFASAHAHGHGHGHGLAPMMLQTSPPASPRAQSAAPMMSGFAPSPYSLPPLHFNSPLAQSSGLSTLATLAAMSAPAPTGPARPASFSFSSGGPQPFGKPVR